MPATVFGTPAVAVELYMAFYGQAPSNPIYQNYIAVAGASSPLNLALTIGNQFANVSDSLLATNVLTNLVITPSTIPAASFTALQTALTQAFAAYPTQRGIVVLNAMNLLSQLETDATFGTVAQTFNQSVANAYVYASNTANVQTQLGAITTTSPLTVNAGDIVNGTSGNDSINGNLFFNAPSGTFFQTLNTGDTVNGGAGTDVLNLGFNSAGAQTIGATLTSIEGLAVNTTGTGATTLDLTNGTGLSTVSISNGRAGGDITLNNVGTVLSSVTLNNTDAGITVANTAASISGTADAVTLNLNQAGANIFIPVNITGYETINAVSTGYADPSNVNAVTLGYSAGATVKVTGTSSLNLSTGASTNAITVDASGMTGTGTLSVTASGGANNVNVTGTANNDVVVFGTNYTTADTYNGGAGTDAVTMFEASAANVTVNQSNLSNLEVLQLSNAATASTYTPAVFGGATILTFANTASAANWTVNYGSGTSGMNVRVNETGAALTVNSSGSATNDLLNLMLGTGTTTAVTLGAVGGTFTSNGFETITLTSNGAIGASNTVASRLNLTATAATEVLNIAGARDLTLSGTVRADQINAANFTGNLSMGSVSESAGLTAGAVVINNGVQITGGSGNDTLFGSDGADQILGGAGNDRIQFGTGVSQGDIVTGGAGTDQFRFVAAAQSAGTAQVVKITDFVAGTDKIGLVGIGAVASISAVTTGTITTADTLAAVYAGAGATTGSTAASPAARVLTVASGLQAGTFLVIDTNGNNSFTDTTDMLVNISGVTGTITTSDFVFA
ncbi:beta strand repeat-containing protein [Ramlibacter albus]|uniref:Calcium-binding protein n=1 Tax=Ramlibacter albus TaxID=2079448 RepID=A0A923S112_9BURK|nr:hypothetical protein [Ramlibacter albus]MBC5763163.1 hypothetical protein [Ramlibacter albus]